MKRILSVIVFSLACIKSFSQTNNSSTMDSLKLYNKSLYPFESKWMEIDGNTIHYIDEGDGQSIVFSHAVIGSSFMYREFVKELRGDYRVIIMDFPGFGLSRQSRDYEFTFVRQARVFQHFINQLQLSEIILVGHDSPSGLLVAAWQPELFKGFVLTDTQIFPSDEYKRIHRLLNMAGSRFFSSFNTATNFLTWGTMKFGMPTKKFTKEEKQEYYKMSKGKIRRQAPGRILKSIRTERGAMVQLLTAFEKDLSQKPVLMIYGINDPVNQLGIPQRMKKMLPNSELHLIEGEKHFPHEGQAKLMSLIMYKWLKKRGL
jgi:haloalkane dehalogenase